MKTRFWPVSRDLFAQQFALEFFDFVLVLDGVILLLNSILGWIKQDMGNNSYIYTVEEYLAKPACYVYLCLPPGSALIDRDSRFYR